jgi:hypothetical protein
LLRTVADELITTVPVPNLTTSNLKPFAIGNSAFVGRAIVEAEELSTVITLPASFKSIL